MEWLRCVQCITLGDIKLNMPFTLRQAQGERGGG
jgi:hypothetical protein